MSAAPTTSPLRAVVVDDTADLRELMRLALTRGGFEVVGEAGDGRAGIETVREQRPDLVLLDLSMPVMDGLNSTKHIRDFERQEFFANSNFPLRKAVTIVALTSLGQADVQRDGDDPGDDRGRSEAGNGRPAP